MRALRIVLAVLGGFLVVSAAFMKFYVADAAQRTPLNVNETIHLAGSGKIIDLQNGGTKDIEVKAISVYKTDGKLSDGKIASFVNTTCAVIVGHDTPDCLPPEDPNSISYEKDYFATDRKDALAVNDAKYAPNESAPHQGLINKFPFDTQQKTYPYWDGTAGKAVDMAFVGTKTVSGTKLDVFEEHISDVAIQVTQGVPGTYSMDRTVWVEPVTGSIVNQIQHDVRNLDNGDPALDLNLAFTPAQVDKSLKDAKSAASLLTGLKGWIPLVLLLAGLFMLAVSFIIGRQQARSSAHPQAT